MVSWALVTLRPEGALAEVVLPQVIPDNGMEASASQVGRAAPGLSTVVLWHWLAMFFTPGDNPCVVLSPVIEGGRRLD